MPSTIQQMYFETENDMDAAIGWLAMNQVTPSQYDILEQGQVEFAAHYYLKIWFCDVDPEAIDFYAAVDQYLYDPPPDPAITDTVWFATETDLDTAVSYLQTNLITPDQYTILDSGAVPNETYYHLNVRFPNPEPEYGDFINANSSLFIYP